jgi:hypothetical protein
MAKSKISAKLTHNAKAKVSHSFYTSGIIILLGVFRKIEVVLKTPRRIGDRITDSSSIYLAMGSNPWFPAPKPELNVFKDLIDKYSEAVSAVKKGGLDSKDIMKAAWAELDIARNHLRLYVQDICLDNPIQASEIAHSAGMSIKKESGRHIPAFSVKALPEGGVKLKAKVIAKPCAHVWECSTDPDNIDSWNKIRLEVTLQCTTKVYGFKPGTRMYFRHKTISKNGPSEYDYIVNVIIN